MLALLIEFFFFWSRMRRSLYEKPQRAYFADLHPYDRMCILRQVISLGHQEIGERSHFLFCRFMRMRRFALLEPDRDLLLRSAIRSYSVDKVRWEEIAEL